MSFFHAYLLGGLSLIAVPVLIHLVTREKPKHLRFPAFRFLMQKYHSNRRKLRVHHLLLLLLRMLLIAALVFALARPRLYSERLSMIAGTQPVVVALLIDTSPSMDYERGGISRLEDAKRRALELLEELPDGSKIALLDSADRGAELTSREAVRERLKALEIRPANGPITRLFQQAFRMLEEEDGSAEGATEPPPRYLYVFSDRTLPSWDTADLRTLQPPKDVTLLYIDVGSDKPTDLAIEQVTLEKATVVPGGRALVSVLVRATGEKADRKITCQIDNDPRLQERRVELQEGGQQIITFEFRAADPAKPLEGGLSAGPHQLLIRLEGTDRLTFNNSRHATFLVRPGRKVLTILDQAGDPDALPPWPLSLPFHGFTSLVKSTREAATFTIPPDIDLVCLHQVADASALWGKLKNYVDGGGKLVVIPGGEEVNRETYNNASGGGSLLPALLDGLRRSPDDRGLAWDWSLTNTAPLMAPFLRWRREQGDVEFNKDTGQPRVLQYWKVTPAKDASVSAHYVEGETKLPAIVERTYGQGRVLLLTSKMTAKEEPIFPPGLRPPTTYWQNSFGFVLVDKVCRYLVGDSVAPDFNYLCGESVKVPLPRERGDRYLLRGPGQPPQGSPLSAPDENSGDRYLNISRAFLPGNYLLSTARGPQQELIDGFSLDIRSDESRLLPRVPKEDIENLLGKDSVLDVEHGVSLREAISKKPQPVELLPYLMLGLLLFLALENVWANRRRDTKPPELAPETGEPASIRRALLTLLGWTALGVGAGALLAYLRGGPSEKLAASAVVSGLFGLSHAILTLARFESRDGAILGGLLGSMVGVLYGWLLLGEWDPALGVVGGMIVGAGALAADGWVLGLRRAGGDALEKRSA